MDQAVKAVQAPKPTDEQSAILAHRSGNLMIEALAGTGKSSICRMIDLADPQPHIYLVFNKVNQLEAEADQAESLWRPTTLIKTFNGLGHGSWASATGKRLAISKNKLSDIAKSLASDLTKGQREAFWDCWDAIRNGVEMAKAIGYIPQRHANAAKRLAGPAELSAIMDETPDDQILGWIDDLLTISISQAYAGVIDFNDQLYMSALFGGVFPQYPLVIVDEFQDLNPVQHHMVAKLTQNALLYGVGDACQAIYAFRGAMSDSMLQAQQKFNMTTLPLSTSFRCPSAITENVRWRVPHFRASRAGGSVTRGRAIEDNSTVICRNNAPLFAAAIRCLVAGHKVDVSGVDLTNRLATQMAKLGPESLDQAQTQTLSAIDDWLARKLEAESKSASDIAECMRIFARKAKTLGGALSVIRHMAAQTGSIRFLTGHKSKGLEWDHVIHLDVHLISDRGQDPNLNYVIDTRSRDRLTYVASADLTEE
jgi:hypothetical protein